MVSRDERGARQAVAASLALVTTPQAPILRFLFRLLRKPNPQQSTLRLPSAYLPLLRFSHYSIRYTLPALPTNGRIAYRHCYTRQPKIATME